MTTVQSAHMTQVSEKVNGLVPDRKPYNDWPNDAGFNTNVEQREPIQLVVKGEIPAFAAGTLYRTGPGQHKINDTVKGEFSCSHWFDGFTHIYRFQIVSNADGTCKVVYNSRRQTDGLINEVQKTGRLELFSFGQKRDPCMSFFEKVKSVFYKTASRVPDENNTGVTIHPNAPGLGAVPSTLPANTDSRFETLSVFTDSATLKVLDPDTLEPSGCTNQTILHPSLSGPLSCAHAQTDPLNGDIFNYNLALGRTATYQVFRTSAATGNTEILAKINSKAVKAAYIHSFFLTPSFVILGIWPSHYALGGISMLWTRNLLDAIRKFDPNAITKWLVIDRKHGRGHVATFDSPAFFAFHSVNAWEEEQELDGTVNIFCDVIQFPNIDVLHRFYYENFVSTGPGVHNYREGGSKREQVLPSLTRYRLGGISTDVKAIGHPQESAPQQAEITLKIPSPHIGELPTINPNFSTKKSRYVYSIVDRGRSSFFDGICKTDLETETAITWESERHTPGEPIFVPRPDGEEEDDGVLLSVILNGDTGTSYLLCLDAKTMKETGRAEVPVAVGIGFHGQHVGF